VSKVVARIGLLAIALTLVACGSSPTEKDAERAESVARTSSSTTSPSVSTSETTPTTAKAPARALHKVLLLGDSEMFDAAPSAIEGFRAAGIDAVSQAFPGTSLLGVSNITPTFPTVVAEQKPDAVVLLYTGVYFPPFAKTFDGRDILLATPEWWAAWHDSAAQATRVLQAAGAEVYWVLLPHNETTWLEHDTRLNDAYLTLASDVPGVRFVDWRKTPVSGPDGRPLDVASIGPDGSLVTVRGADGRHFSVDASRVLAGVMVETVLKDFGLSAAS
jgi:hypothetical protein